MINPTQLAGAGSRANQVALAGLFGFAATIPHSIALGQVSALLMLLGWLAGAGWRSPVFRWRTPWTIPLLLFVSWSVLSSALSYEPLISLGKLRGVSLVIIFFLVFNVVRSFKVTGAVLLVLTGSSIISVAYVYASKVRGRGLEIVSLSPGSPLMASGLRPGDVILEASGRSVNRLQDLVETAVETDGENLELFYFRPEIYVHKSISRPASGWPVAAGWGMTGKPWRNFRAAGFYGWNYFTYAEVMQLLGSLMLALALTAAGWRRWLWWTAAVAAGGALALTLTRAAWGASACSVALQLWRIGRRWMILPAALAALLITPWALRQMKDARGISFLQSNEPSSNYRLEVWRQGWELFRASPRHILFGVGMDSIKTRWREWDLFQGGRIPVGHMHSTPLQLAVERGAPALALWLWWFTVYVRFLWKKTGTAATRRPPLSRALVLGTLAGTVGFLASSLVHYNFGDSEVVMVVYLLMGLVAADSAETSA